MGMFNTIYIECPKCKKRIGAQTKSGTCLLDGWNLENAPNQEIRGILGETYHCQCGHVIQVNEDTEPEIKIKTTIT